MKLWNGFEIVESEFEGFPEKVVFPKKANGYLAVKTEYWDAFPEAAEISLLEKGFHLCYIKNENRFGTKSDLDRKARFIQFVQNKYLLKKKTVLVGMSCGGLIAIKFAACYPEFVAAMYLDAPVLNYMSWPCGFGIGNPMIDDFSEILNALKLDSISELLAYRDMPLDHLNELVEYEIPVIMVSGDSDTAVPYVENGIFLERIYRKAHIDIKVYMKPGGDHHPHGMGNPEKIVDFVMKYCR